MRARSAVLAGSRSLASVRRVQTRRHVARALSSSTEPPSDDKPPPPAPADDAAPEPPARKRVPTRVALALSASVSSERDALGNPMGQNPNILWTPADPVQIDQDALPPQEIYNEALSHLLITLSARTQRRAAFLSDSNQSLIEPTFGLYCPLEGGDYVLDNTVRALARQVDADVVVIDCAQLAAGEWGVFGKEAECVHLTRNPLHFPDASGNASKAPSFMAEEDDGELETGELSIERPVFVTAQTFALPASRASTSRRTPPLPRSRLFFDQVVSAMRPGDRYTPGRPRIIYVRDFGLLASQSSAWMPSLFDAVRERRRTPSAKAMSPVPNPTTIILGITPSVLDPGPSSSSGQSRLPVREMARALRMLQAINAQNVDEARDSTPSADVLGEGTEADKWREKRNRMRLRRWEDPDFDLTSALPSFSMTSDEPSKREGTGSNTRALSLISRLVGVAEPPQSPAVDEDSQYYRASFIVPRIRSQIREKETRISRRLEANELLMRMGVGHIGGILDPLLHPPPLQTVASPTEESSSVPAPTETTASTDAENAEIVSISQSVDASDVVAAESADAGDSADALVAEVDANPSDVAVTVEAVSTDAESSSDSPDASKDMTTAWGHRVESWNVVKEIADRALGTVVAARLPRPTKTLDPIHVPWEAVHESWLAQRNFHETRKSWIKNAGIPVDEEVDGAANATPGDVDEVVERLKRDSNLNAHEQRLLSCIVDTPSMPTSFSQVHLPTHTIDSVRTLVSLPLLHPAAFASGVLKQHTMTGALLFGPPGTGKTLLVRALARESGARMMIVTPSDIYDMYVGEGEKLVRAVFSIARRLSPCVVFIDEIDSVFGARSSPRGSGSAIAHRGVITEFMQEMDGLKTRENNNVIVIGATNRPYDLDDAVLRRLPRRLMVDLPGEPEREEILKIMLRDEILEDDVDLKALAKRTENFSGSDLKHLCVSAALDAVKEIVKLPWSTEQKLLPAPAEPAADAGTSPAAETAPQDPQVALILDVSTESTETAERAGTATATSTSTADGDAAAEEMKPRKLAARHFAKALREITPSASEASGSLTELRKWNDEFGENGRTRKRMWGGKFGFVQEVVQQQTAQLPGGPRI